MNDTIILMIEAVHIPILEPKKSQANVGRQLGLPLTKLSIEK